MAIDVIVPPLGESVTQAILIKWHKGDGAQAAMDEPLCELETDKANVDIPAPAAGVVRRVRNEGETVRVGEVIARIDSVGAAAAATAPATAGAAAATGAAKLEELSPATRRIVEENKVDPDSIPGSGRGGRLTKEDVQNYLDDKERTGNGERAVATAPPPAAVATAARHEAPASMTTPSPKTA